MKKFFTLLLILILSVTAYSQTELIRNGDFTQGASGSDKIHDIAHWSMDEATPASGWWAEEVGMTSPDTTLYQVIGVISGDSVKYVLSFDAENKWISEKMVVIISTTEADSTVRTPILSYDFVFGDDAFQRFEVTFGFGDENEYAGKRLVVEFDLVSTTADPAWADLDNVSLLEFIPGINAKPVAALGPDQTVRGGDLVTLDASGSSDPEGADLTYHWVSVYPGIVLSDVNAEKPTFTAPDVDMLSKFQFTLHVKDGELSSDTIISTVTVIPAGELIRNGGFEDFVTEADPSSTSLKDIANWNIDSESISGGRWGDPGLKRATLASIDPPIYQVVDEIGTGVSTYSLSFSARSSWNSEAIKVRFSACEDDSTVRVGIDSTEFEFEIDPPNGVNVTDLKDYTYEFAIPANSEFAGMKLVLEFWNIPYDDNANDGWLELDNVSLVVEEEVGTPVQKIPPEEIVIYPNPARNTVYINSNLKVTGVEIFSVNGQMVRSVTSSDIRQFSVNGLSNGLHMIRIKTPGQVYTTRLVIE